MVEAILRNLGFLRSAIRFPSLATYRLGCLELLFGMTVNDVRPLAHHCATIRHLSGAMGKVAGDVAQTSPLYQAASLQSHQFTTS